MHKQENFLKFIQNFESESIKLASQHVYTVNRTECTCSAVVCKTR